MRPTIRHQKVLLNVLWWNKLATLVKMQPDSLNVNNAAGGP